MITAALKSYVMRPDAARAAQALRKAGIKSSIEDEEVQLRAWPWRETRYLLVVSGDYRLIGRAQSVLRRAS